MCIQHFAKSQSGYDQYINAWGHVFKEYIEEQEQCLGVNMLRKGFRFIYQIHIACALQILIYCTEQRRRRWPT